MLLRIAWIALVKYTNVITNTFNLRIIFYWLRVCRMKKSQILHLDCPKTGRDKFRVHNAKDEHFPLWQVSPTSGNLEMISNPKNWLLCIQRQKQSSDKEFGMKEPLYSEMLPKQVYSDSISLRLPMAFCFFFFWRETQKIVFMEQTQLLSPSTSAFLYLLLSLLPFHWQIWFGPLVHLLCSLWKI